MYRHARSSKHLGDVGVRTEEVVKDRANLLSGLHAKHCLKARRVNRDIARVLRIEDRAVQHSRLIITTVIVLQLGLYLALLQLLFQEARELR